MKRFPIFKPGKHTAMSGTTLDFNEAMLKAAVAAYDPSLHEAPIVVGHPKDNGPAYGWVQALSYNEATGEIEVDPAQVDEAFAEMVQAGRFKKRSASWYLPDSPANPKPGTLYLRHVAFLGAQPPALKGLRDVSFNEGEEGVVEFAEDVDVESAIAWLEKAIALHEKHMAGTAPTTGKDGEKSQQTMMDKMKKALASLTGKKAGTMDMSEGPAPWLWSSMASMFRSIREYLIAEKGQETADKLIPNYLIADLEREAAKPITPAPAASFSEHDMKPEELKALQDKAAQADALAAENATLKAAAAKAADFAERETSLAAREAKIARAEIEARVESAVQAGKVLPAQKKSVVDFAMSLDNADTVVDFGEGDKAEKISRREAYLREKENGPAVIDFGERARETGSGGGGETIEDVQRRLSQQVATGGKANK